MDARYWKEFEDMEAGDKGSGSEDQSPRYSSDNGKKRRRSSSSSSSCSSSRSSSSSSRHHSDSYRANYRKRSPSRGGVKGSSYGSRDDGSGNWFPPPPSHQYPPQSQDVPPSSSYLPNQYPQGPPPVQGQYPPNFQGPNFGNNYHSYGGYEPPPANFYPPNFPPHSGSQPHNYPMGGGPGPGHPPGNWEMFPDPMLQPPIIQGSVSGDGLPGPPMSGQDKKAEEAKKEAIEQELIQQKRTLSKQREDYVRRKFSLSRELCRLKDQKRDLLKEKSKDNERILRENAKLQGEIQQKLKSIDNVIEMLTNIIGDAMRLPDIIKEIKQMEKEKNEEKLKKTEKKKHSPEGQRRSESADRMDESGDRDSSAKNVHYYDPGLHWCSDCNIFPKTIAEYLQHLHSQQHKSNEKLKFEDYPWHNKQNLEVKSPPPSRDVPSKRIPIRGVQFLVPATAWFCGMCKVWLGDSHCATKHVQSTQHSLHYNDFISKNPHWEVDWLTERTRSYERKSEAQQDSKLGVPPPTPYASSTSESLSNQLLAILANSKGPSSPPPAPPPPPAIHKSSSSSEEDDDAHEGKLSKKSKKLKKNKNRERSLSKEKVSPVDQIKLSYKSMTERKVDSIPVDDNFISEWMPRVEKRELVQLRKKQQRMESEGRSSMKKSRRPPVSRDPSSDKDKKPSPYQHGFNEDGFDKRSHFPERDPRNKRKYDEDSKNDRFPRYEKGSPKDKYKFKGPEKYRSDKEHEDHRLKKDPKNSSKDSERDRIKKSPLSRIKDNIIERKKNKNKPEKTSDEDIHETAFEKRALEIAAKKKDNKKLVLNILPKTKLPFIGRMPILKKKVDQKPEEKEVSKKDNVVPEVSKDSPEAPPPPEATVVEPVIVREQTVDELPKSTLIISKRPRLAEPGIVKKEILFSKPANDNLTEQDMELDEESGIPKDEDQAKDELHKDFKDALDLLFPEEKKKEEGDESSDKKESETKLEEQLQPAIAVPPSGYMMAPGYDVNVYPPYYDQQAYIHQQWAQMGYEQTGQYAGPFSYPPPAIEQPPAVEVAQTAESVPEPAAGPKKKKNPPSQRKRRHMREKKAKEAREKANDDDNLDDDAEVAGDDNLEEDSPENGEEDLPASPKAEAPKADISDLAMLGIDEDDAAAMGFY